MKKNMGKIDKILRLVGALIIAGLFFGNVITGTLGIILIVVAVVFVATSFMNFCPMYSIFGISSCPLKEKK